ncbi:MAG: prepilin-type N-terminal cleavage/methylation domain-containing protein [Candidatus Binatia bacterium]
MMVGRSDSGFTLLEVLVALTLFAVVAAGLSVTTIGSVKANSQSRRVAAASALIQDKIEQLRALDPSTDPVDLQPGSHDDPLNPVTPLGGPNGTFTRTWVVTPNTPKIGLSEVVLTISWNGPDDPAPRSISAATYVCRSTACN